MYTIRINQWDNRFGRSNLFFSTSRMLTIYTAGKVHKPITTKCSTYGIRVTEGNNLFLIPTFHSHLLKISGTSLDVNDSPSIRPIYMYMYIHVYIYIYIYVYMYICTIICIICTIICIICTIICIICTIICIICTIICIICTIICIICTIICIICTIVCIICTIVYV